MTRTEEQRERENARRRKKADEYRAAGLTSKGKPRKPRAKPSPEAQKFVIGPKNPTYKRRPPTMPKKGETEEQRLARGRSVRGTPMARKLDESIQRRLKEMD